MLKLGLDYIGNFLRGKEREGHLGGGEQLEQRKGVVKVHIY